MPIRYCRFGEGSDFGADSHQTTDANGHSVTFPGHVPCRLRGGGPRQNPPSLQNQAGVRPSAQIFEVVQNGADAVLESAEADGNGVGFLFA
jgi:hypothetical protein